MRYADDFSIYTKSKKEAGKIGNEIFLFLKEKLKLPINREKSGIRRPSNFELLGHSFVPTYQKGSKGKYQLVVKKNRWESLKRKLKQITKKTRPYSFEERLKKLAEIWRGWINNYRLASIHAKLKSLDEWLRNRLRYCIWSRSFGRRSLSENGKTLSDWALIKTMPMHGRTERKEMPFLGHFSDGPACRGEEKEDGQLLKVQFWGQRSLCLA